MVLNIIASIYILSKQTEVQQLLSVITGMTVHCNGLGISDLLPKRLAHTHISVRFLCFTC